MAISPREDYLILKDVSVESRNDLCDGEVFAVGPGLPVGDPVAPDIEVGNTVVVKRGEGETLLYAGAEYLIVRDSKVRIKL